MPPLRLPQETQLYWELLDELERSGAVARATIVKTWGSTPRETGAKMLVTPSGAIRGTVGGGCGEAEVWQEAKKVLQDGQSRRLHIDLTEDTDSDNGKVCGGRFDVFIELWRDQGDLRLELKRALETSREIVLATYLGPERRATWKKPQANDPQGSALSGRLPGWHTLIDCSSAAPQLGGALLWEAARQVLSLIHI